MLALHGLFVRRDDITMLPTYDSIVVDLLRVQKDIVSYEQVPVAEAVSRAGFVRIVDIACSPPQFTDKGIAVRYIPQEMKIPHEPNYSR
jgi:hypothetical protein